MSLHNPQIEAHYRFWQRVAFLALGLVVSLFSILLVSGCAGLPADEARGKIKPAAHYGAERSFAGSRAEWPADAWWTGYGDPQLDRLIAEALAGAPNLAVAQARLRRAQALAGIAEAATLPLLSANGSISEQKQSRNYLSPRNATPEGWNDYGRATLDFSWELDFWGKNRAALAAATSEADASAADVAQARLVLSSSIASAYAELARLHAALDTASAALAVRAKTAELFRQRYANGLETLGSVRQVESRRAAAQADVLSLEEQLGLQRNRVAALMGAGPDRGLDIARPRVDLARSIGLPAEIPAELLGRRPDIAAARMRAEAADKRIDQARASFYPNVNLVAFLGYQSLNVNNLAKADSAIGSVGPAISLPIFDGGRLRGQLRSTEADQAEAVANYERTVVQALQEVADAALSQKALGGQIGRTDESVEAAREAWRIQNNRYEGGLATYLDVLSAEDSLLSTERALTDLQSRSFALDVALVKALGGGYSIPNP
ncbi:MAG TPA: efflux transporter outer membrane subunit [Burkholderiales bacterium]|nr:efflux transporter outer membrane subunit [Burkholderiales bacterium]